MNYKSIIASNLETLFKFHKSNKEPFKANAYKKALDILKNIDVVNTIEDVKEIGGVKTQQKIKTIIDNNKNLEEVEKIINDTNFNTMHELMGVHGIGPTKARQLVHDYFIKSVTDLKKNEHLLNDVQKTGLKYYKDMKERIPRAEMLQHEKILLDVYHNMYINDMMTDEMKITGSFRRGLDESGDIDVLITGNSNVKDFVDQLLKNKYIVSDGVFAKGEHKFMGMCKLKGAKHARRLDILYTPRHEYPFALLYFTGNKQFNVTMRSYALTKGYSLNEQGLMNIETSEYVNTDILTEEDIFTYLNYPYVNPSNREI